MLTSRWNPFFADVNAYVAHLGAVACVAAASFPLPVGADIEQASEGACLG